MQSSLRPKARPKSLTKKKKKLAPSMSLRPKKRPEGRTMPTMEEGAAIERGNRAAQREAYDQRTLAGAMAYGGKVKKMKGGGKIRGYGMARGGKACKMR